MTEGIRLIPVENCYLCGSHGDILYSDLKDSMYSVPGRWSIRQCSNKKCRLAWLDPRPTEKDIGKLYQNYYTHNNSEKKKSLNINLFRIILIFAYNVLLKLLCIWKARHSLYKMYLKKNPSGKVLEIGCGDGGRLAKIKELGWVIEGQEIDPIAGKKAEMKLGVRIHIGPIAKLKLKESSYDAIIMNHVIEHIHNPIETLTEVHRMLKPQGMLVIVTPNMQSRGHGRFGRYWLGLDPPRHLFLYNPDSLQALVSKLAFTIDSCRTTAANAELLASGSLSIQRSGKYVMGKSQPLTILVRSMCFQLVESLFGIVDFHKSDETVLIASKTRNSIQS